MKNRWSDAARLAALAVRQKRAFAANPVKVNAVPQLGGVVHNGTTIPPKNVYIPPNGGVGTQYEEGMKDLVAKKKLMAANTLPQPSIFSSSTGPKTATAATPQGSIRYDPKQPDHPQSPMPPKLPPGGGTGKTKTTDGTRFIIGGLRYTRVGNKLVPDVIDKTGKVKNFYMK
jgi:hypothetical protein